MSTTGRHRILPLQIVVALVAAAAATAWLGGTGRADMSLHHPDVERWRPLVEQYWAQYGYADEVDYALMVMWGESWGVPTAQHPGSKASGLFQHLPIYWEDRSAAAGWAGASIWDPEANIAVAAWLRATSPSQGWRHWEVTHVSYPPGSFGPDTHWEHGRYVSLGGGSGNPAGGPTAPGTPSAPRPSISVTKTADGPGDPPEVREGDEVPWTFQVTNTGDVDLWNVYLWDDAIGEIACDEDSLPAGASVTCGARHQAELGLHEIGVWAFAWDADGREAEASSIGTYFGIPAADLALEARVSGYPADDTGPAVVQGDRVLVSYHLTNTGEVPLYAPFLWDDALGEIDCGSDAIAPTATIVCTAWLVPDRYTTGHLAWAWAWTEVGNQLEASDPLSYQVVARDTGPTLRAPIPLAGVRAG
jgi:hypothetical protein